MLFEKSRIERYECQNTSRLNHAFDNARNRDSVSRSDKLLIKYCERGSLLAVNRYSRVIWGKAVCEQLEDFFCSSDTTDHNQTIYWVTLVDINCAMSVGATKVDIESIKQRLRSGLSGRHYLGVVEPAYYVNLQHGRFAEPRCMFWHLHAATDDLANAVIEASPEPIGPAPDQVEEIPNEEPVRDAERKPPMGCVGNSMSG